MKNRILSCLLAAASAVAAANDTPRLPDTLSGGEFTYMVQKGDSLGRVGSRFGVDAALLARLNGLESNARLQPAQELFVENRHIVPEHLSAGILINLPQRMLFFFKDEALSASYPVGLGRPDWPTPTGKFKVLTMEENPTWDVPLSIQEEMRLEGKEVITQVPPGPNNPLGKYWLGLSLPAIGIHGTIAPTSVYRFQSHGCIRLHPDDIFALFANISVNLAGKIIYRPVLLAQLPDGRIFLEAHPDVYKQGGNPLQRVQELAAEADITEMIDWEKVAQVIKQKEGLAREVGAQVAAEVSQREASHE
ncbi:MAG: L,D-transpeptidase family protein [Gammaproteobacteria bacterium]|nr:L,D-transpeptidase family protein [Gammaproteobacteria bacterium]